MKANTTGESNLLSILQGGPEGSRLILKVGAAGAAIIALWVLAGLIVLPVIVTFPVMVVMLAVYGAALVFVTASIVKEAAHWEVESAQQTQKLVSSANRPRPMSLNDGPTETVDSEGNSTEDEAEAAPYLTAAERFHQAYFALRLEQEVRRCRMHGETLSAVIVRVELPGGTLADARLLDKMSFDIAKLATDYAEAVVIPNCIGPAEYGFCLLNVGHDQARAIAAPLLKPLGNYHCEMGIASYPEDDGSGEALIARARKQLDLDRTLARTA